MTIDLIMFWLACAVAAYVLLRVNWRLVGISDWIIRDRMLGLFVGLFGPVGLLSMLMLTVVNLVGQKYCDRPAKW